MKKAWRWVKKNKLATVIIATVSWAVHWVIENTIVRTIAAFAGYPIPALILTSF
jgi:hypothetical protein